MNTLLICLCMGIGGFAIPVFCAVVAQRKNRPARHWFFKACMVNSFVPVLGGLGVLAIASRLPTLPPSGRQPKISDNALLALGCVLTVMFGIGLAMLLPAIATIIGALSFS